MPTQAELDKVQPLVNELMGPLVRDYKAKKKLPVEVGDGAVRLVAEADASAASEVVSASEATMPFGLDAWTA